VWSGLNLATFRNRWQWEGNATFGGSGGAANNNAEIWWYYAPGALTSAFVGALLNANFNDCATVNVVRVQNGAAISQWCLPNAWKPVLQGPPQWRRTSPSCRSCCGTAFRRLPVITVHQHYS